MDLFRKTFLLLLFSPPISPVVMAQMRDSSTEPPLRFEVRIEKKVYQFENGLPKQINQMLDNPEIEISIRPTRRFWHDGCVFDYDRSFSFKYSSKKKSGRTWLFTSNDNSGISIFLYEYDMKKNFVQLIKNEASGMFEKTDYEIVEAEPIVVRDAKITGKSLKGASDGDASIIEYYELPSVEGSRILLLNDLFADGGVHSKAFIEMRKAVVNSLKTK